MTRLWTGGQPISVAAREDAWPRSFEWRGRTHPVKEMCRRWRVDEGWWRSRIWREYFKLVTATGLVVVIYRDLVTDRWYLGRLYD